MKHRPDIAVTVVRIYHPDWPFPHWELHDRVLKMLEQRLGIWDVRKAPVFVNEMKKRRH